jgi:hypothetical protein
MSSALVQIRVDFTAGPQVGDYFMMAMVFQTSTVLENRLRRLGIANVVELFKRNEPDLASLARFRGRDCSMVNATNLARDEDFDVGQGRISER